MVPRLALQSVSKRFGATVALDGASLSVGPGEVHALIGENGAGKSTLMKILSGALRPDGGEMLLDGQRYSPSSPAHAHAAGVAMIYQELNLAPSLSVEENVMLGAEPHRFGWIRSSERRARAEAALRRLGADDLPLAAPVKSLTIAQQQLVEIARALVGQPRVLIMDEPTSSLTLADTRMLFRAIRDLRGQGVSIVYISHFLEECQEICERFTVLRDGRAVAAGDMTTTPLAEIVRAMVGRDVKEIYAVPKRPFGAVALELQGVSGSAKPIDVSLRLRAGEIFGLAGLIGSGRTETARAVFGLDSMPSGSVAIFGHTDRGKSPAARLRQGLGLLSENRKEEGLLLNRDLAENLLLSDYSQAARAGLISSAKQRAIARRLIDTLEVKTQGPDQVIGHLSGGNQQKVALGRLLHHQAKILLLDEPTRGIDVGSKQQIYRLMGELASQGKAILFISSYLPELLGVCDTIGVMSRGHLMAVKPAAEWTEHDIMTHATGSLSAA